jgi:uncharacterized protein (TIGR02118 family)
MFKMTVFYPNDEGKKFDMEYYCNKHIPLVHELLGDVCKGVAVDQGLEGSEPGAPPTYIVMTHIYYDSAEAFQSAFEPHAETFMEDMPNYTDIECEFQVSEVKIK